MFPVECVVDRVCNVMQCVFVAVKDFNKEKS